MHATLYTAYHKPAPLLRSACVTPIHVGRQPAGAPLAQMIGDDTGTHISERNDAFCELTALYWAWKNDHHSDLIGLMHYRRVLDLSDRAPTGPVEALPGAFDIPDWCAEAEDWLAREAGNWDLVVPRLHTMGRTMADNYRAGHQPQDWDALRSILAQDYPAYLDSFDIVSQRYDVRLGNMALMTRPLFERYCSWLFDLLFQIEALDLDRSAYSATQARYLGFLAERLLTVFVHHLQQTEPALRIREVSILNLSQAVVTPYLAPDHSPVHNSDPEAIHLAFAADEAYLPHAGAMLRSVIDHVDKSRPLHLYFLHSDIPEAGLLMLSEVVADHGRAQLHAINTGGYFDASYRSSSRAPSNATYNRFLLFSLLPGLARLIYLDVDVIVRRDIGELYDTEMGQAQIGAVPDWIMTRTLTGPTRTIDPDVPDLAVYHRKVLGLNDAEIARYFNAGVLVFNFAAMADLRGLGAALMREAREGRYLFRDQDILNKRFKDHLLLLDPRWNVFNSLPAAYGRVPQEGQATAMAARQDPWLVHYADRDYKPWRPQAVPQSGLYWQALIRTPFYGVVLGQIAGLTPQRSRMVQRLVAGGRALAERVPVLKGPLLRIYARSRKYLERA